QHQRIVVPPTSTMKENPLQYRVRGTPVPTTRTRGTNYPKSTLNIDAIIFDDAKHLSWANPAGLQWQQARRTILEQVGIKS
ncbi:hypothetical protein ACL1IJ_12490, partial [Corynebacterium striatum]